MTPFDDEQRRALVNLQSSYDQWMQAARDLDDNYKGSLRWKFVSGKQYLYHRVSDTPLVDRSRGARSKKTETLMIEFQRGKAQASARHRASMDQAATFAVMCRALKLALVPSQAARLLRHFDRKRMLGANLLVVGTIAMSAYEVEAGCRIFQGFDATQDFDLTWRGVDPLQLQTTGPVSLLGTLREVDPLYTKNTERSFQAVSGNYEVEVLAAPSTLSSFPKNDLVPLSGMTEQEVLLLGKPVRHVISALDGTPAPISAPDPRWMALHKLWLSKKPARNTLKKPKDQAQGLLLMRAVISRMPHYPLDLEFLQSIPDDLLPHLMLALDWVNANQTAPQQQDEFTIAPPKPREILRMMKKSQRDVLNAIPAMHLRFDTNYDAPMQAAVKKRLRY